MRTLSFVAICLLSAATASAQDATEEDTLDLDAEEDRAFVITGSEYLPEFTVLIDRENLSRAHDLKLEEEFLPKIIEAIESVPF